MNKEKGALEAEKTDLERKLTEARSHVEVEAERATKAKDHGYR